MEQKFECIEKHLYKRVYQTSKGERRILYYALFRDRLKGKPRKFRLRSDLKPAREDLQVLEARKIQREDFDAVNITTTFDQNANGEIDISDYDVFESCLTGPGMFVTSQCAIFDANDDCKVDMDDYALFQGEFGGSQ